MPVRAENTVRARLDALRARGQKALCQFVIAGDPALEISAWLVEEAAQSGVDILEFCIPFQNSITDGPVIRRGYERALAVGSNLAFSLRLMERAARHLPVVCLADYRYTVRPVGIEFFLDAAATHGAGAVLIHGLPPLLQAHLSEACKARGLGQVTTAYPNSNRQTVQRSCATASAFLYLVSSYGRSGSTFDQDVVAGAIARIRQTGTGPVGVGFGLNSPDDHRMAFAAGADMTILGSAMTDLIENHLNDPANLGREWSAALRSLAWAKTNWKKEQPII